MTDEKRFVERTFMMTVQVPEEWIRYVTCEREIFGRPHHAGYWLYGAAQDDELGWLVFEMKDERRPDKAAIEHVKVLWLCGKDLPENWYRLDQAAAIRAWEIATKRWGELGWPDFRDGPHEDEVIQLTLLGELRYG